MTKFTATRDYKCAIIYVDHYSKLGYIQLQRSTACSDIVEGKLAFKTIYQKQVQ